MDFCEGAGENDGPLTTGAPIPVRKFSTFTEKVRRRDFPATSEKKGTFLVTPLPNVKFGEYRPGQLNGNF